MSIAGVSKEVASLYKYLPDQDALREIERHYCAEEREITREKFRSVLISLTILYFGSNSRSVTATLRFAKRIR